MIEIKNLGFTYHKKELLFSKVDLAIAPGGICGLLGKNGAGKTTLLKLIAGLIFPQQGHCRVLGHAPKLRQPSFLNDIFFLPEELFLPNLSIEKYAKLYAPFYPKFDYSQLQNHLQEFELSDSKLLTEFSYGQKKKFLIAFGLATGARLLILDEPTNGLDIPSKAQFRKLLAATINDDRLYIISTHQVHDVENLVDSIVILDQGEIALHQSMNEIIKHIAFLQQQTEPSINSSLYWEKNLQGYEVVMENIDHQDTQADLELLFNAVLNNKNKIQKIFL